MGVAAGSEIKAWVGEQPPDIFCLCGKKPVLAAQPAGTGQSRLWFSEPLVSAARVYIFGGGHVSQELAPLLTHVGFRCVVFEDREEFAKPELFGGAEVLLGDFKNIGASLTIGENDYAVIVTRGHLWDFDAEAFSLRSKAVYIGVIGSKTKHAFVQEKLLGMGFTEAEIKADRVHAPIGLDIKSDTPAEIAVSIAAEMIRCRNSDKK
jgi:xanthine dehydrogenase accessory factor